MAQLVTYNFTGTLRPDYSDAFGTTIGGSITLDVAAEADWINPYPGPGGQPGELRQWWDGGFSINGLTNTGFAAGTRFGGYTTFDVEDRPFDNIQHTAIRNYANNGNRVIALFSASLASNDGVASIPKPWNPFADQQQGIALVDYDESTDTWKDAAFTLDTFTGVGPDSDSDGIDDAVDPQPLTFSLDFSDGTTTGAIVDFGDQIITIVDAPDPADGVLIVADLAGGALPAIISIDGGASILSLTAGDQVIVTHGSVILDVLAGAVEATFLADNGSEATSSLPAGISLTFEPENFTFIAPVENTQPVEIIANGTEISVPPGETVVAPQAVTVNILPDSLNLDSNGTLTVVIFGAADFNAAQIDVGTVRFAGASAWQWTFADQNGDGRLDLQLKFRRQDTIFDQIYADLLSDDHDADGVLDSTHQVAQIDVTGQTLDDALFSGSDNINLFLSGRALRNFLDNLFEG
jgi:hypothetical protein